MTGALSAKLVESCHQPAVTHHQLAKILFELYKNKSFRQIPIRLAKALPTRSDLSRACNGLLNNGVLSNPSGFPPGVFRYMPQPLKSVEGIICSADAFAYVSHLSAMEFHGLTNRLPMTMFVTTLPPVGWKLQAKVQMHAALGNDWEAFAASNLLQMTRPKIEKVERKQIHTVTSTIAGAYINVRGSAMRVSSLGRTF